MKIFYYTKSLASNRLCLHRPRRTAIQGSQKYTISFRNIVFTTRYFGLLMTESIANSTLKFIPNCYYTTCISDVNLIKLFNNSVTIDWAIFKSIWLFKNVCEPEHIFVVDLMFKWYWYHSWACYARLSISITLKQFTQNLIVAVCAYASKLLHLLLLYNDMMMFLVFFNLSQSGHRCFILRHTKLLWSLIM